MVPDGERVGRTLHALPLLPPELWRWLISPACVRADAVAVARARLASGKWPTALEVADAVLARGVGVPALR